MARPGRLDNSLIGNAGVYFVASQLSLRKLIVMPTIRNAPGIDLVAVTTDGSWHANIQVKTSQDKVGFWPVGGKYRDFHGPGNYYAFVRYLKPEERFEVFIVPADQVIQDVERATEDGRKRGCKDWGPCWPLPKAPDLKQALLNNWPVLEPRNQKPAGGKRI